MIFKGLKTLKYNYKMSQPNWIIIRENQKATYRVRSSFPYYLQMGAGSTVIFESLNGG